MFLWLLQFFLFLYCFAFSLLIYVACRPGVRRSRFSRLFRPETDAATYDRIGKLFFFLALCFLLGLVSMFFR